MKQLFVFAFVNFAWIFFRARELPKAITVITRMFTTPWTDPQFPRMMLVLVLAIWAYQFLYTSGRMKRAVEWAPVRVALAVAMIVYLTVVAQPGSAQFIYFEF